MTYFCAILLLIVSLAISIINALVIFSRSKSTYTPPLPTKLPTHQLKKIPLQSPTKTKAKVAVIDDDIFIREAWELFVQDFEVLTFDSPETFLEEAKRRAEFGASFNAIVVDYNFGCKSSMSGADFAPILRKLTKSPIILSTDMCRSEIEGIESFDLHLDKKGLNWNTLVQLLPLADLG